MVLHFHLYYLFRVKHNLLKVALLNKKLWEHRVITLRYKNLYYPQHSASQNINLMITFENKIHLEFHCCLLFSHSVMSDPLWPHGLQHARLPCPSQTSRTCSNSCPLSQWCHPTTSSSVIPFSCLQSFPASVSSNESTVWIRGPNIGSSASVLSMSIQDWFPLSLTGLISLQSKGLSKVFSNTTINSLALSLLYGSTLTSIHD